MSTKQHWETVYAEKSDTEVSWYQADPQISVELIDAVAPDHSASVIDVGGGTSLLVDRLLDTGFRDITVLDISAAALQRAQTRLGERSAAVRWMVADVATADHVGSHHVWHDRAAFHFLTDTFERHHYAELIEGTVPLGGHVIIATFALDGPEQCSGLDVRRYDAAALQQELGAGFALEQALVDPHPTPWGSVQPFTYALFRRV